MKPNIKSPILFLALGFTPIVAIADDITKSELDEIKIHYESRISALEESLSELNKATSSGSDSNSSSNSSSSSSSVSSSFEDSYLHHKSSDGNYEMKIDGRIMIDIGHVDNDNDENKLISDNDVRRARLGLKSKFYKHWATEFDVDLAGNEVSIKDLWLSYSGLFTPTH